MPLMSHEATIEDLRNIPEKSKAEIVHGELIFMPPTGFWPSYAAGEIYASLREHARQTRSGYALPDNTGFIVNLPNRKSFSPDAAFYTGTSTGMKFLDGAPAFAVEVRSENDYGPQAEHDMAEKRRDYFTAGTLVVWDVDLLGNDVVKAYRGHAFSLPVIYQRGDLAEAEPAVPGWKMAVDDLFV
jgi:Uma2 family endonuclease